MKLLFDESAPYRLALHARSRGHDVTAIAHDYPQSIRDPEVLAIARSEGRILVTNDLDFGELIVRQHLPHAGVILLRIEGLSMAAKVARFDAVLRDHTPDLDAQLILVVTRRGVRVRRHPR